MLGFPTSPTQISIFQSRLHFLVLKMIHYFSLYNMFSLPFFKVHPRMVIFFYSVQQLDEDLFYDMSHLLLCIFLIETKSKETRVLPQ